MRQRRVIVLAKACAVVGIALAAYGTSTDRAGAFRSGVVILIAAASVHLHVSSRMDTQTLMAHQVRMARLTMQERQRYAEMGYKAAQIEALADDAPETAEDAQVVRLPLSRKATPIRRDGSA
jgi:hypothetical protein